MDNGQDTCETARSGPGDYVDVYPQVASDRDPLCQPHGCMIALILDASVAVMVEHMFCSSLGNNNCAFSC